MKRANYTYRSHEGTQMAFTGFERLATYERRVPDFIALFAFNLLSNAR